MEGLQDTQRLAGCGHRLMVDAEVMGACERSDDACTSGPEMRARSSRSRWPIALSAARLRSGSFSWRKRCGRTSELTPELAAAALTDGREIPTIRLADTIRKNSPSVLVKKITIPQNVGYVLMDQAGRYSVCRLPSPSRQQAMLKKPRRATAF
jgi:hypothetical protein